MRRSSTRRAGTLEVLDSPSLFFKGMAGSRIPVAWRTAKGRVSFPQACSPSKAGGGCASSITAASRPKTIRSIRTARPAVWLVSPLPMAAVTILMPHSRARIPQRADELASGELGRGFAVDAHVPQRPCVVRLILQLFGWRGDEAWLTRGDDQPPLALSHVLGQDHIDE
jgi:hypothetical protein